MTSAQTAKSSFEPEAQHELRNGNRGFDEKIGLSEYEDGNGLEYRNAEKSGRLGCSTSTDIKEYGVSSKQEWMYAFCTFFCLFSAGFNDGSIGPLLLRIQSHYEVSYTVVSIVFICNAVGFFLAAGCNVFLMDRFGFGKVIAFGGFCQIAAYAIQAPAPPFPLFAISYVVAGFSMGIQDAYSNGFIAKLTDMSSKMALAHAAYGAGALVAPLISTQFARLEKNWHYFYLVSLGVAVINTAYLMVQFRGKEEKELLNSAPSAEDLEDDRTPVETPNLTTPEANMAEEGIIPTPSPKKNNSGQTTGMIMKSSRTHILAFWTLVYVGLEVGIGSWTPAYLEEVRGASTSAGYVSTGFFGGLTVGRLAHVLLLRVFNENIFVLFLALAAIGLELVVWLVPNVISGAVCVSFVGFCLGPMYVVLMNVTASIMPPRLMGGAIGYIAAFGQAGSAIWPFICGVLASRYGSPWVLQPLVVALMGVVAIIWMIVLFRDRHTLNVGLRPRSTGTA